MYEATCEIRRCWEAGRRKISSRCDQRRRSTSPMPGSLRWPPISARLSVLTWLPGSLPTYMVRSTQEETRLIQGPSLIRRSIPTRVTLSDKEQRHGIFSEDSEPRSGISLSIEISQFMNPFTCNSGRRCSMCSTIRISVPQLGNSEREDLESQTKCFHRISVDPTSEAAGLVLSIRSADHVRSNSL